MKRGISLVSLAIVIVVMVILAGIVIISGLESTESINASMFASEILNIQNAVHEYHYRYEKYPVKEDYVLDTTTIPNALIGQFDIETITNNKIDFKVLDLSLIGMNDTEFGKGEGTDVYVVSEVSGKVYYIKGVPHEGTTYYTLIDELYTLTETNSSNRLTFASEIKVYDVIFGISDTAYTNKPITVQIKLPIDATYNFVTTTESKSVSEETVTNTYKVITVNETSADRKGNYNITVNYTYKGTAKTATYEVTNFDNTAPTLDVTEETNGAIKTVKVKTDEFESGVKKLKYELGVITDKAYFENYGKTVANGEFIIASTDCYTIYVEDNATNKNTMTTGWVQEGLKISRGEQVLTIGDNIYYDETADGTVAVNENVNWQVLGTNGKGELLIMSSTDVVSQYRFGPEDGMTDNKVKLKESQNDWLTGAEQLDALCEPYKYGKSATGARSIRVEDIDKITGYKKTTYGKDQLDEYGNEITYTFNGTTNPRYTTTNGLSKTVTSKHTGGFHYYNGTDFVVADLINNATGIITTLKSDYYYYLPSGLETVNKTSKAYIMLFGELEGEDIRYWLASSWAWGYSACSYFGMRAVGAKYVRGDATWDTLGNYYSYSYGVRAVVSLSHDIQLTGSSNSGWTY